MTTGRAYDSPQYKRLRELYQHERCHWCGGYAVAADPMVVDHDPPLRLGGSNDRTVPAHYSCNARRGGALGAALAGRRWRRPTPEAAEHHAPKRRSRW